MKKTAKAKGTLAYPLSAARAMLSVREAKAHFSALVGRAAEGEEIIITWHGRPRACLAPAHQAVPVFRVDRAWLETMPRRKHGTLAEDLVRADRDGRG